MIFIASNYIYLNKVCFLGVDNQSVLFQLEKKEFKPEKQDKIAIYNNVDEDDDIGFEAGMFDLDLILCILFSKQGDIYINNYKKSPLKSKNGRDYKFIEKNIITYQKRAREKLKNYDYSLFVTQDEIEKQKNEELQNGQNCYTQLREDIVLATGYLDLESKKKELVSLYNKLFEFDRTGDNFVLILKISPKNELQKFIIIRKESINDAIEIIKNFLEETNKKTTNLIKVDGLETFLEENNMKITGFFYILENDNFYVIRPNDFAKAKNKAVEIIEKNNYFKVVVNKESIPEEYKKYYITVEDFFKENNAYLESDKFKDSTKNIFKSEETNKSFYITEESKKEIIKLLENKKLSAQRKLFEDTQEKPINPQGTGKKTTGENPLDKPSPNPQKELESKNKYNKLDVFLIIVGIILFIMGIISFILYYWFLEDNNSIGQIGDKIKEREINFFLDNIYILSFLFTTLFSFTAIIIYNNINISHKRSYFKTSFKVMSYFLVVYFLYYITQHLIPN